jgi:hypothetical protein
MYSVPQLAMITLAAFYSNAPSLRRFLNNIDLYRKDRGVDIIMSSISPYKASKALSLKSDRVPCDNQIRKLLDDLEPEYIFEPIWETLNTINEETKDIFRIVDETGDRTLVLPYELSHHSSSKMFCQNCISRSFYTNRKKNLLEHFHSLLGFSLVDKDLNKFNPQLPPAFLKPCDYHGYKPKGIYPTSQHNPGPLPKYSEVFNNYLNYHGESLQRLSPVFFLHDKLGTFKVLSTLQSDISFILVLNKESLNAFKRKIPQVYYTATGALGTFQRRALEVFIHKSQQSLPKEEKDFWNLGPDLHDCGLLGVNRSAYLLADNVPPKKNQNKVILTNLKIKKRDISELLSYVQKLETYSIPENIESHELSLKRTFGHGKVNLAEIFASLNILAINLLYLGKYM